MGAAHNKKNPQILQNKGGTRALPSSLHLPVSLAMELRVKPTAWIQFPESAYNIYLEVYSFFMFLFFLKSVYTDFFLNSWTRFCSVHRLWPHRIHIALTGYLNGSHYLDRCLSPCHTYNYKELVRHLNMDLF